MISRYFRRTLLRKSLLWAVAIEGILFACAIYTGAIGRGPHDPLAFFFALSQGVGIVLMGPISLVLSDSLHEHRVSTIVWSGVFVIQSLFLAVLIWAVVSFWDRSHEKRARETR